MKRSATALAAVLACGVCVLAGCGGGNPYALPAYGGPNSSTAARQQQPAATASSHLITASPAATPPAAAVTYHPADAWGEGAWVERGKIVATSTEQRAVVTAMTSYLSVRVQLSNTWQVDEPALEAVASGEAVTSAQQRAERQRERDQRSIGRFIINVSSVRVSGNHAAVTGCHFDATSEVDQNGNVLIPPVGGVLITMQLQRTGTTWRVDNWPDKPAPTCDWRA